MSEYPDQPLTGCDVSLSEISVQSLLSFTYYDKDGNEREATEEENLNDRKEWEEAAGKSVFRITIRIDDKHTALQSPRFTPTSAMHNSLKPLRQLQWQSGCTPEILNLQ